MRPLGVPREIEPLRQLDLRHQQEDRRRRPPGDGWGDEQARPAAAEDEPQPAARSSAPTPTGVIRRPPSAFPAAGVGIASQRPFLERISGPASWAPMITGAFDQTTAAAFRLTPVFGKTSARIEFASRAPSPAPAICPRQPTSARCRPPHRRGHRLLAGGDLRRHHRCEVRPDVERQLHAGLTSIVQTSRSRSRTGSPWTTKVSPSRTIRSPGRGLATSRDPEVEPRRLRPEPRRAELGDGVGPAGDDADGDRLPVRRLVGRVPPEVRIGEQPLQSVKNADMISASSERVQALRLDPASSG